MSRLLVTNKSFELLEPYEGKLSRTVLRGESSRKGADLLDIICKYSKRYSISFIVNCTFYCISAKYLSLQAKTFAPFLHLFQLYPLIEFAKQLPEPIGYIFLIDD